MAGGTWLTNLLISLEKFEFPLSMTISSVFDKGAATSAAIYPWNINKNNKDDEKILR